MKFIKNEGSHSVSIVCIGKENDHLIIRQIGPGECFQYDEDKWDITINADNQEYVDVIHNAI